MIIPARFNGPPGSANGGYTAGLLAGFLGSPTGAVVTLRQPPPLEQALRVATEDNLIRLYGGEQLIAEAAAVTDDALDELVAPVGWDEAVQASARYAGFAEHPFPTCFVCGPGRPDSDGLSIFPGRLPDRRTAATWVVPPEVSATLVWAALDCPGGWSAALEARPYVLGRLTARVDAIPAVGDQCVVMGQCVAEEGRKAHVLSTVYSPQGTVVGRARATWIAVG